MLLFGIPMAIPAMLVGYLWARYAGKKVADKVADDEIAVNQTGYLPSLTRACLPVIIPIILIGLKSFLTPGTT